VHSITNDEKWREVLRAAAATLGVVLATALLLWARVNETTAGLVFLTMVVWFATRVGIRLAVYVALVCALCFDYFFIPPVHTLLLAGPQEWIEMLSFAVSCVIVGRLAERARNQTLAADQRREDVERLYTLSQEMMMHEDASRFIHDLPRLVERSFALEAVILYVRDSDQFYGSIPEVPASVQAGLRSLTAGPATTTTLPGPGLFSSLPLMLGLKPLGALAWRPDSLSREVATAVGAQVAIALTRSLAIETYTRMEAAREGERLRTALIDSLTHELRTPLTSIRAAATTLVEAENLDEAGRRDLAALVDEESARLDILIGEAVEMAEIDANVVQVHAVPHHVRALLDHVVEESKSLLARHRVVISVEPPDTPVWFDPHLLGRVFRHLVENAARYTPAGGRISLTSRQQNGRLHFTVEDDGPGIDSADLPLIFEKFYRGKKSSAHGKGTGMGLPIARAILAAHGGQIEVASQPGHGAAFHFWVPLIEKEPAGVEPERIHEIEASESKSLD
jgi:two-component system, OmpR family, sensor histidine kinase KdpD